MTLIFIFIVGLAIGSFLNVLIDRLPKGQSIMGRSHCDHCKRNLQWYELIPIVSFIVQNGKSKCCRKKLSWQYPVVEMITGMSFLLIFNASRVGGQLLISLGIVSCLIVIFVADFKYKIIPDSIQVVLFIFSVMLNLFQHPFNQIPKLVKNDIASGIVVMLPILLLYLFTRGKGMGFGDVKLAFIMGFLLGIKGGAIALYIAFITGAVYGLVLILLKKKKLKSKIAFGPFLVIGTVMVLFWGEKILETVKKIYGF